MGITYDDICNEYERSLDNIEKAEFDLKEELDRFIREFKADLKMADEKYQHREFSFDRNFGTLHQRDRIEFTSSEYSRSDFDTMSTVVIGREIEIILRIVTGNRAAEGTGTTGISVSTLLGTVQEKIYLYSEPEYFVYQVGPEKFRILKDVETGRYIKLFTCLKQYLLDMCRFS